MPLFHLTSTRGNFPFVVCAELRQTSAALTFMKDPEKILSCINDRGGGGLWSYGVLVMGVIKVDSNALVCGSCGAFLRVLVPWWRSSMQSLRAPAGGGKVLKCYSCEYELDINLRSWAIQGWQPRLHLDFSHDAWGTKRWTKVKRIVCQHKGLQSRGPL